MYLDELDYLNREAEDDCKPVWKDEAAIMVRLGGEYERAHISGNLTECIRIEKLIGEYQNSSENWLKPLVVRGRNIVRRNRGLEEVY